MSVQEIARSLTETKHYCEYCTLVPISDGEQYCLGCLSEILSYLAHIWDEQVAVEKGLY